MTKGFGEKPVLNASVVAAADELLFQLVVYALGFSARRDRENAGSAERAHYDGTETGARVHALCGYQGLLRTVNC